MKYPYIGQYKEMMKVLFTSSGEGFSLEHPCIDKLSFEVKWNEDEFFNITTEYLANTYGEVKSKEHAEFIVKLAENHGYTLTGAVDKSNARTFVIDGENKLLFFMRGSSSFNDSTVKKITIPLPPECEERKPKEVIANNKKHTLNLVTGFYDFGVIELGYATGSTLEKLQEAVDYQVLSFVDECDVDKDGEWPKVGDCAILKNENDYKITHGAEAIGEKVKVMSLFKDGDSDMAAIKHDITNYCFRVDMLSKPKTPEQELRDSVELIIKESLDEDYSPSANAEHITNEIFGKYNITKKPQ